MFDQGNKWYSTIPACLPDGEYLLRHETINLGSCATVGSCQFYPTCEQVKVVGGKGTKTPSSSELVAFPGAYDPNDPKIKWNSNLQDPATYKTPGPTVFKC